MDDDCENDIYVQSPFHRFIQINNDDALDSFDSLSNLIKTHSTKSTPFSNQQEPVEDSEGNENTELKSSINVPSIYKSSEVTQSFNLFNNDSEACHNSFHVTNSNDMSTNCIGIENAPEGDDCDDFGTLAEYTKSFLQSKGNFTIPSTARFQVSKSPISKSPDLVDVGKKLSQVHISDQNKCSTESFTSDTASNSDYWNIDLSVALQDSKVKKLKVATSHENANRYESPIYSAHVKQCDLDISRLADEKLMYSNAILSSFGYVLSRKWKALPKRFRTVGVHWPYKLSKSFKFDSPSPDDIILSNKCKMRTTSLNES